MYRTLIVEMKTLFDMSDRVDAFGDFGITFRHVGTWRTPVGIVCGRNRVLREGMQNIGEQKFLVLLFVIETEFDQRCDDLECLAFELHDQPVDGRIDVRAIVGDVGRIGSCQHSAMRTGMARACRDVIRIEQERILFVEFGIALAIGLEQKLFEEPGRVRAVPFGGAGVRHRLDDLVFRRQRRCAALGFGADHPEGVAQFQAVILRFGGGVGAATL